MQTCTARARFLEGQLGTNDAARKNKNRTCGRGWCRWMAVALFAHRECAPRGVSPRALHALDVSKSWCHPSGARGCAPPTACCSLPWLQRARFDGRRDHCKQRDVLTPVQVRTRVLLCNTHKQHATHQRSVRYRTRGQFGACSMDRVRNVEKWKIKKCIYRCTTRKNGAWFLRHCKKNGN